MDPRNTIKSMEQFLEYCYEPFRARAQQVFRITVSVFDMADVRRFGVDYLDLSATSEEWKQGRMGQMLDADIYQNRNLPIGICEVRYGTSSKSLVSHIFLKTGKEHDGLITECGHRECCQHVINYVMET